MRKRTKHYNRSSQIFCPHIAHRPGVTYQWSDTPKNCPTECGKAESHLYATCKAKDGSKDVTQSDSPRRNDVPRRDAATPTRREGEGEIWGGQSPPTLPPPVVPAARAFATPLSAMARTQRGARRGRGGCILIRVLSQLANFGAVSDREFGPRFSVVPKKRECELSYSSFDCNRGAVDCEVGKWGQWSKCSQPCGGGTRERTRGTETEQAHGGKACPHLREKEKCNTHPCPPPTQIAIATLPTRGCELVVNVKFGCTRVFECGVSTFWRRLRAFALASGRVRGAVRGERFVFLCTREVVSAKHVAPAQGAPRDFDTFYERQAVAMGRTRRKSGKSAISLRMDFCEGTDVVQAQGSRSTEVRPTAGVGDA